MKLGLGLFIRGLRQFWRFEIFRVYRSPIREYAGLVLSIVGFVYAKYPKFVASLRPALVLAVLLNCGLPEVCQPVIGWVPVDVVNGVFWPSAVGPKPNQSMRLVSRFVDFDAYVSASVGRASYVTDSNADGLPYPPAQKSIRRIVIEEFTNSLGCKIGFSHEAVLSLIGQRLYTNCSRVGPCHFTSSGCHA